MSRIVHHNATLTSGTKIVSSTSGFQIPEGFAGISKIGVGGANVDYIEFTFPGGEHSFAKEEVPRGAGEIAVETRVQPFVWTDVNWRLPKGTRIDFVPHGGSAVEGNVFIEYARAGDFTGPPLHWLHKDITTATTADNDTLADIPPRCTTLMFIVSHGANQEFIGMKFCHNGDIYDIISNHQATHAAELPLSMQRVNEQVQSDKLFYADQAAGYGTGAAGHVYMAFVY